MMVSDLEHEVSAALHWRASDVPESSVNAVRSVHYRPRKTGFAPRVAAVGALTLVGAAALAAVLFAQHPARTNPQARIKAVPLAYVGTAPRLTVTALPSGFQPGPAIPIPVVSGQPAQPGVLPDKTFVRGSGSSQQSIIIAEGESGEGPVSKLLNFAAANPSAVTKVGNSGRQLTIVDLAAAGAGSGSLIYFSVGSSAWAMISGNSTQADLLLVAEGITYTDS
jgi:hypothetical protein